MRRISSNDQKCFAMFKWFGQTLIYRYGQRTHSPNKLTLILSFFHYNSRFFYLLYASRSQNKDRLKYIKNTGIKKKARNIVNVFFPLFFIACHRYCTFAIFFSNKISVQGVQEYLILSEFIKI